MNIADRIVLPCTPCPFKNRSPVGTGRFPWHRPVMSETQSPDDFRRCVDGSLARCGTLFAETPLQLNDHLSARFGARIWLKREDLSPVRSYKIRGAFNFIRKALKRQSGTGLFVCASAGNHAQGFAYVCRHFGRKGVVFMPVTTPQQKIDKTRSLAASSSKFA
jgi:threonine dehydratase